MKRMSKASAKAKRLRFGANKYYALNLMLARWLRHHAVPGGGYHYVTLGGTELRDIVNAGWIDRLLITSVSSYEENEKNAALAEVTAVQLASKGVHVSILNDDIFTYRREIAAPHIFYVDLMGICRPRPYLQHFSDWFLHDVLRSGDLLLITSYLGRNIGWPKVLEEYDSEFRQLRFDLLADRKEMYHRAHPLFVLNRALTASGLQEELALRPLGTIRYMDTSSMGLYGIALQEGSTTLPGLLTDLPFWNTNQASIQ
jgi:hypothetical protein